MMTEFARDEIIEILKDDTKNDWLFSLADEVRKQYVGDEIHLRALIEYTNICKNACKYCGLRCENRELERYRLTPEEIIDQAYNAVDMADGWIANRSHSD
jgi:biotin synthase